MTFYVEKRLPLGSISFGVTPSLAAVPDEGEPNLLTGPNGEYLRRGDGFFFGGHDRFAGPSLPVHSGITTIPFLRSMKPESRRDWALLALMLLGFVFILLGIAVTVRKGPQGWVEIVLGAAMIVVPILRTLQRRRRIRRQEERERAEREAEEKRNGELLAAYTTALGHAREDLAALERERDRLTLPYEIWAPAVRRTVLLMGFEELARDGRVAECVERAGRAAGLRPEDIAGVKADMVRTVVWHLLAAGRQPEAEALRRRLGASELPEETSAVEQFHRVRDLKLTRGRCTFPVGFNESCYLQTESDRGTVHVTNKRLIVESKKRVELPIPLQFDVVAHPDAGTVTVKTEKRPLVLSVAEPIYTAAVLDAVSAIDERPRAWA